jgi:hypothetical protein
VLNNDIPYEQITNFFTDFDTSIHFLTVDGLEAIPLLSDLGPAPEYPDLQPVPQPTP